MKPTVALSEPALALKEAFFSAGQEILRPVKTMIADSYPAEKREKLSSFFDEAVLQEYDKACRRATSLLYEQRNIAQSKWLPRYEVNRSKHSGGESWEELRGCLVDNCLDRLAEVLIAQSPILVKKEYVEPLQAAVEKSAEVAKARLNNFMLGFHVVRKQGYVSLAELYD